MKYPGCATITSRSQPITSRGISRLCHNHKPQPTHYSKRNILVVPQSQAAANPLHQEEYPGCATITSRSQPITSRGISRSCHNHKPQPTHYIKRNIQVVPQSQAAANPLHQEEYPGCATITSRSQPITSRGISRLCHNHKPQPTHYSKRNIQVVPQSQAAANPLQQEEEKKDAKFRIQNKQSLEGSKKLQRRF